jgi:hypothetical protein
MVICLLEIITPDHKLRFLTVSDLRDLWATYVKGGTFREVCIASVCLISYLQMKHIVYVTYTAACFDTFLSPSHNLP